MTSAEINQRALVDLLARLGASGIYFAPKSTPRIQLAGQPDWLLPAGNYAIIRLPENSFGGEPGKLTKVM